MAVIRWGVGLGLVAAVGLVFGVGLLSGSGLIAGDSVRLSVQADHGGEVLLIRTVDGVETVEQVDTPWSLEVDVDADFELSLFVENIPGAARAGAVHCVIEPPSDGSLRSNTAVGEGMWSAECAVSRHSRGSNASFSSIGSGDDHRPSFDLGYLALHQNRGWELVEDSAELAITTQLIVDDRLTYTADDFEQMAVFEHLDCECARIVVSRSVRPLLHTDLERLVEARAAESEAIGATQASPARYGRHDGVRWLGKLPSGWEWQVDIVSVADEVFVVELEHDPNDDVGAEDARDSLTFDLSDWPLLTHVVDIAFWEDEDVRYFTTHVPVDWELDFDQENLVFTGTEPDGELSVTATFLRTDDLEEAVELVVEEYDLDLKSYAREDTDLGGQPAISFTSRGRGTVRAVNLIQGDEVVHLVVLEHAAGQRNDRFVERFLELIQVQEPSES